MKQKLLSLIALAAMMVGAQGAWAESETITTVATYAVPCRLNNNTGYMNQAYWESNTWMNADGVTQEGFFLPMNFDMSDLKTAIEGGKIVKSAKLRLTHYRGAKLAKVAFKAIDASWVNNKSHRDNLKTSVNNALSNDVIASADITFDHSFETDFSSDLKSVDNYQVLIDLTDYINSNALASTLDFMMYSTVNNNTYKAQMWTTSIAYGPNGTTAATHGTPLTTGTLADNLTTLKTTWGLADDDELKATVAPALIIEVEAPNNTATSTSAAIADIHVRKGSADNKYNEAYVQMWNKSESDKAFGFYAFNLPDDVVNNPELTTVTSASLRLVTRQLKNNVSKTRFISIYGYGNNFVEGTSTYNTEASYISAAIEAGRTVEFEAKGDRTNKTLGSANISDANYQTLADWTNTIDLTSHVAANATTQRMNLMLIQTTEDSGGNEINFFSRTCPNSIDLKDGDGTTLHTYAKADIEPQITVTYSVGYTLTVTSAGMSTLVLPFQSVIPSGVTLYTLTTDGSVITATEVTGTTLAANTPVLVVAEAGDYTFNATSTTIDKQEAVSGALTGVYTTTDAVEGCYVLQKHGDNAAAFYKLTASSNKTVNPFRAYLTAPAAARELSIAFGESVTTSISEELRVKSEKFATAPVYDLQGRRVAQPTKGLYIKNGKKYMVK